MTRRTYIVTFDALNPAFDPVALKAYLRTSKEFQHWWNHLPYVYLLTTDLDAEVISGRLRQHSNGARFLVMEVDPQSSEGWLPKQSWQWIRKRERETHAFDKA